MDWVIGFQPRIFALLSCVRTEKVYGIIVQNNPINFVDPDGLFLRLPFRFPYPRLGMPKPPPNWPKPPGWNNNWQWRYPEGTNPNQCPRWFDPKGGEWRWHGPDKYHPKGHWDYNSWDKWNSPWRNIEPSILPVDPPSSSQTDWDACFASGECT
jgi:hypothetical protein